jgi:hypothetical protein
MSYRSPFFTIPTRIMDLPGLTLAFLRFYETIFQFWHRDEECFLSNEMIKKRTGISSSSTIQEAFEFFEKNNEIKRIMKNGRRFIEQPPRSIEIEPLSLQRDPPSRCAETPPLATARHNKNNINNKNINRESTIRKKRESLSENFKPDQERQAKEKAVSERCGISTEDLRNKFRTIEKRNDKKSADWQVEYELFLLREKPSVQKVSKKPDSPHEIRSTIPEYQGTTAVKKASANVVTENMAKIHQLLSRKMINVGRPTRPANFEERKR